MYVYIFSRYCMWCLLAFIQMQSIYVSETTTTRTTLKKESNEWTVVDENEMKKKIVHEGG